jgi:6-phosphogluconolactonase (cycloisomerase 2 family)
MGGFIAARATIRGAADAPGIPLIDSPSGGIYETPSNGIGMSIVGKSLFELLLNSLKLGYQPDSTFTLNSAATYAPVAPRPITQTPDGRYIYTATGSSGQHIYAYLRDALTGALTAVTGSPFTPSIGNTWDIQTSPNGAFLLITNDMWGQLSSWTINQTTGALTLNNEVSTAYDYTRKICVSADGAHVYVASKSGTTGIILSYSLDLTGTLAAEAARTISVPGGLGAMVISPSGLFLYASSDTNNTIGVYSINQTTYALTLIQTIATGDVTTDMVFAGDFLLAVQNTSPGECYSYNIAADGTLTSVSGNPFTIASGAQYAAMSPDGAHLAVTSGNYVYIYTLNTSTGALTIYGSSPYAAGTSALECLFSTDGNNLYVCAYGSNLLTNFTTTATPTHPLAEFTFDPAGGSNGTLSLTGNLYLNGVAVASVNGSLTQPFSAKTLTLDNATGGLVGTATNNNAVAGMVGELLSASLASGSATSLTTDTPKTIISLSLTAGDWDVEGVVGYLPGATTNYTHLSQGLSTTTNTMPSADSGAQCALTLPSTGGGSAMELIQDTPTVRMSLAATTTVYLVSHTVFTTSTMTAFGSIRARRFR